MEFKEKRGIYLQIAETMMDRLLDDSPGLAGHSREAPEEERFPSIRETAEEFGVNPNTVMRSYSFLQEQEIIHNRRGIGFFVSPLGRKKALDWKKKDFIRVELPQVFRTLALLDLTPGDLQKLYEEYRKRENKNENK